MFPINVLRQTFLLHLLTTLIAFDLIFEWPWVIKFHMILKIFDGDKLAAYPTLLLKLGLFFGTRVFMNLFIMDLQFFYIDIQQTNGAIYLLLIFNSLVLSLYMPCYGGGWHPFPTNWAIRFFIVFLLHMPFNVMLVKDFVADFASDLIFLKLHFLNIFICI